MAKGPKVTRNSTTPRPPHPQMDRLAYDTNRHKPKGKNTTADISLRPKLDMRTVYSTTTAL